VEERQTNLWATVQPVRQVPSWSMGVSLPHPCHQENQRSHCKWQMGGIMRV